MGAKAGNGAVGCLAGRTSIAPRIDAAYRAGGGHGGHSEWVLLLETVLPMFGVESSR